MAMTATEEAEWRRKYGGGEVTNGVGQTDSTDWVDKYNTDPTASQAGGGRYADSQIKYAQDRANASDEDHYFYSQNVDAARAEQGSSLGLLRDAAMGNAPSRAELLSRNQMGQAASAQNSLAASARGPAALAMAQQQAAGNTARSMSDISANTTALRADEMARARDSYFQGASGMRGQDQSRVNDATQRQLGMMGEGRGWGAIDQQGRGADARLGLDAFNANQAAKDAHEKRVMAEKKRRDDNFNSGIGTAVSAAGSIAGMASDVRAKENIQPVASQSMEEYLATLQPASYQYNGAIAGAPSGQQIGPASAQNIAATQVGQNVVEKRPDGMLAINAPAAIKAGMSADAHINDKASRAEAKADAALRASAPQYADAQTAALMSMGSQAAPVVVQQPRTMATLTAAPTVVSAKPKDDWLGSYLAGINATNNVKGPR